MNKNQRSVGARRGWLLVGILATVDLGSGGLLKVMDVAVSAAEPSGSKSPRPWKIDIDILHSANYEGHYVTFSKGHLHVDQEDRLWMPLGVYFPGKEQNTDAWRPLVKNIMLLSTDRGRSWEITQRKSSIPSYNRVTMPDGTILEVGGSGYFRFPRSEVKRLEREGYHVWDLGPKDDYCAIIYDLLLKRSIDGGKTWQQRAIHKQLPFFAIFVARGPLRLLRDNSLVFFAYGATPEERLPVKDDPTATVAGRLHSYGHGRWSIYCVRSDDGGQTWKAVRAADGSLSPTSAGFSETFPIISGDGNVFVLIRTGLGRHAYLVTSSDGGRTWTKAVQTPIQAKHPLPKLLRDGSIVCSYQRRFAPPFGVRARFTSDQGKTWSEEIVLRDDIPISNNLAEPTTVEFSDGTLFTAFQGQKFDERGRAWPFIGGCHWSRSYRGPWAPKLEVPKPTKKINTQSTKQ